MDNNIHVLDSESIIQILEMLLSEDESTFNLALEILYRRDKNNIESEKHFNKLLEVLNSNPKCDYIVAKIIGYNFQSYLNEFNINKTEND